MIAKEASIKDVVETEPHRLEVPFFQRRYVWEEENWEEMLQAIENFDEERPFWGSIIIKKAGKDKNRKFGRAYIIDGQQRLTTIAILTKAIYDSANKQEREKRFRRIVDCDLLFNPYASAAPDEYEIIIEHSRADRKDFEYIIKTGIFNDEELHIDSTQVNMDKHTGSAILRCYLYYMEIMKSKSQKDLELLMNNLYNDEKVFVLITLDDNDINEQIIFDSINRAGQKLTTSDIIKNNIFKKLMSHTENNQIVEKIVIFIGTIFFGKTSSGTPAVSLEILRGHISIFYYIVWHVIYGQRMFCLKRVSTAHLKRYMRKIQVNMGMMRYLMSSGK